MRQFSRGNVTIVDLTGTGSWMIRLVDDQGNQTYTQDLAVTTKELGLLLMCLDEWCQEGKKAVEAKLETK